MQLHKCIIHMLKLIFTYDSKLNRGETWTAATNLSITGHL